MTLKTVLRLSGACIAVLGLAACGGGGGGDGDDTIISSGLLTLEIPTEDVPAGLQALVDNVQTANETGTVDLTPTASATYTGTFGFGVDNSDAIASGDVTLVVNGGATAVDATFDSVTVEEGAASFPLAGSFGGTLPLSDGYFSGNATGTLTDQMGTPGDTGDDEDYSIDATIDGVFESGGSAFGSISGDVTNPDLSNDGIDGLFFATD